MSRTRISYGPEPEQFGHLYLPDRVGERRVPVVMVIHGGYWNGDHHLNLGTPLATELARRGVAAWNIEYRRLGAGGRWPEISADVTSALNAIGTLVAAHARSAGVELDPAQVRVVGHSAGGQLAVWLAGEDTVVRPSLVIGQAAALDLASAGERGRRVDYLEALFGAPYEQDPQVYRSASPRHRLPIGRPIVLIHGSDDKQVPAKVAARYAEIARETGDDVALHIVDGEDHFAFLNKNTACWKLSLDLLVQDPTVGAPLP